jgi:hypothetical protein
MDADDLLEETMMISLRAQGLSEDEIKRAIQRKKDKEDLVSHIDP